MLSKVVGESVNHQYRVLPGFNIMFLSVFFLTACLLVATARHVAAYSDPEPCAGSCWAHDPALIQRESDGLYFRFSTDTYIDVKTSTSLSGPWVDAGSVLPSGSSIVLPDSSGLWVRTCFQLPDVFVSTPSLCERI